MSGPRSIVRFLSRACTVEKTVLLSISELVHLRPSGGHKVHTAGVSRREVGKSEVKGRGGRCRRTVMLTAGITGYPNVVNRVYVSSSPRCIANCIDSGRVNCEEVAGVGEVKDRGKKEVFLFQKASTRRRGTVSFLRGRRIVIEGMPGGVYGGSSVGEPRG